MIDLELKQGITETLDILEHMEKVYVDKIPQKFKEFLVENKAITYNPNLDHSKKLKDMKLKDETKNILGIIYLKYWCDNENKLEFKKKLKENELTYQKKLKNNYNNINNALSSVLTETDSQNKITTLIKCKETIFTKIVRKIKSLFTYEY